MTNLMTARCVVVCALALGGVPSLAAAQSVPAPTLVPRHLPMTLGQPIVVTSAGGARAKGRVLGLGDTWLEIQVKGKTVKFAAADVQTIEHPDSLVNGAVYGGIALGLFAGLTANSCSAPDCELIARSQGHEYSPKSSGREMVKGALIGAAVGVAIDYLRRRAKIFER